MYLVIFHTFSGVMQLEKVLKSKSIAFETLPAPRKLSTDCGVAIRFHVDDLEDFLGGIKTTNIHRIYQVDDTSEDLVFEND